MTTPSQVQVEQRARSLCLRNFTKACNRYETFLWKVGVSVEENQLYFDDIVSTWNLVQDKQEAIYLHLMMKCTTRNFLGLMTLKTGFMN